MRASRTAITDNSLTESFDADEIKTAEAVPRDSCDADDILLRRSACMLGERPDVILESLPRFGSPRVITGNHAVRVDQLARTLAVVPGGALVILSEDTELWPFPANWRLGVAVDEPQGGTSAVSLRFFDGAGARVVEFHVDGQGIIAQRVRACIARWRSRGSLPPRFERAPRAHIERDIVSHPGLDGVLRRARESGSETTVRLLETRHGLSRLEAISMMGPRWARRISTFDLAAVLAALAVRELAVRLIIGNPGASYVGTGVLPLRCQHRGVLSLRTVGSTIDIRLSRVAQLWAVKQTSDGRVLSSLEAFDTSGDPAFLLFGARETHGNETPSWARFVEKMFSRAEGAGELAGGAQ